MIIKEGAQRYQVFRESVSLPIQFYEYTKNVQEPVNLFTGRHLLKQETKTKHVQRRSSFSAL